MRSLALREFVDIQMGHSFRAGLEPDPDGSVGVIQMKDLGEDDIVDLTSLTRVSMDVRADRGVRKGDVIFRSRGDHSTCAIVAGHPGSVVVAAPLLRLRVTDRGVLPAYLAWYINQSPVQAHFAKRAEGSNVKMINTSVLRELEVDVPSQERQSLIVELAGLSARQRILSADIDSLRSRLLSDVMMYYATGSEGR